jgi:ribosomal-protein-alanine N-acetyltransferase
MALIETERLLISKLTQEDAAFIFKLVNSPTWLEHIGNRHVTTIDDARQYLAKGPLKSYTDHGFGPYKVLLKSTNTAIGMCGLLKRDILDDVDLGYALLPAYTGHGYAYESAAGVMEYAQHQIGLDRLVAITTAANVRSLTLLQKLGLRFERTLEFYGQNALLLGITLRQ